jgi:polysaccharide biosynthesis protein PslG
MRLKTLAYTAIGAVVIGGSADDLRAVVTADSLTWEGQYNADVLPGDDGWTDAGLPSFFTTLPGDGSIRLNNLAIPAANIGWWAQNPGFDFSTGMSVEFRAKVNDPTSNPNAMFFNIEDVGGNDFARFRLFGSGQVQVAGGIGSRFEDVAVDVSQYHTYRMTIASGAHNINLYVDGEYWPEARSTLTGAGSAGAGQLAFGDAGSGAGSQSDWSVDYIRWTNTGTIPYESPPTPPITPLADRIGVVSTFTEYDKLAMQTRQAGAGWIRINFPWSHFEPDSKGVYNWGELDQLVEQANARGLKIMGTLSTVPEWARPVGSGLFDPPTDPQDWSDSVTAVVERYQDNIAWGIWNEVNLPGFWSGTKTEYTTNILRPAIDAIKAADPDALIVAGGMETGNGPDGPNYFDWKGWMTAVMAEGGADIDVLGHHEYRQLPGEATDTDLTAALDAQKTFLQSFGKPVWLTETGWLIDRAGGEQNVADNYTGMLNTWLTGDPNRDWIEKIFAFALTPSGAPNQWNLVDDFGDPRLSYLAIQDFAAVDGDLNGDGFVGVDDLNIVLSAWNQTVNTGDFLAGDPSGDGFVGVDDLNVVLANWNSGTPPSADASNTVPEPTSMLVLVGLGLITAAKRR